MRLNERLRDVGEQNYGNVLFSTDGGSTWSLGTVPSGVKDLSSVSCASTRDCFATGMSSMTAIGALVLSSVVKATSKTALKLSATKLTYGDEGVEQLSVTVSPEFAGSTPYGSVTIKESTTTLCVITLSSGKGSCTLSSTKLPVGTYSLVTTYAGSTHFGGSASAKETLTVVK
ncbi:MAG: Ig-like domain-containing protein [Acidimicrobiales bacterium]